MKTTYKFVDLTGDPITQDFPPPNVVIPCDIVSVEVLYGDNVFAGEEGEMVITLMYRHDLPVGEVEHRTKVMGRYDHG